MLKSSKWQIILGIILLSSSAGIYLYQISIFAKPHDTLFYFLQDIAFVPIQILVVTLIIEQILNSREQAALLSKMNMVIGAFFSECGTELVRLFMGFDADKKMLMENIIIGADTNERDFDDLQRIIISTDIKIDSSISDINKLTAFLISKRNFLLRLLENPNLLEHDTFTNLLWSVFHLTEELGLRCETKISGNDAAHISNDIKRAYALLIIEWLSYMKHLRYSYPYLYSLSLRINPFNPNANVCIGD